MITDASASKCPSSNDNALKSGRSTLPMRLRARRDLLHFDLHRDCGIDMSNCFSPLLRTSVSILL